MDGAGGEAAGLKGRLERSRRKVRACLLRGWSLLGPVSIRPLRSWLGCATWSAWHSNDIDAMGSQWSILSEDDHQSPAQAPDKRALLFDANVRLQVWLPNRRKSIAGCRSQGVRIIWTGHASDRQGEWQKKLGITRPEVEALLQNPEQVVPGDRRVRVAQRRRDNGLLRVAFTDVEGNRKIVTVYWTSKVAKYWQEGQHEDSIRF